MVASYHTPDISDQLDVLSFFFYRILPGCRHFRATLCRFYNTKGSLTCILNSHTGPTFYSPSPIGLFLSFLHVGWTFSNGVHAQTCLVCTWGLCQPDEWRFDRLIRWPFFSRDWYLNILFTLKIPLSRQSIPNCNPQSTGVPLVLAITVTLPTGDSYDASFTTHSDIFSSRSRNHLFEVKITSTIPPVPICNPWSTGLPLVHAITVSFSAD